MSDEHLLLDAGKPNFEGLFSRFAARRIEAGERASIQRQRDRERGLIADPLYIDGFYRLAPEPSDAVSEAAARLGRASAEGWTKRHTGPRSIVDTAQ